MGKNDPNHLTGTWLDCNCGEPEECKYINGESRTIFITAVYWVITTLTTVGYGDIKGFHSAEYVF
jgi:hypothetical protein